MRLLQFLHSARHRTGNSLYPNFITRDPVTPVGPATITDALLVFCDICSSSLSLSFESLDSILISNFYYYFHLFIIHSVHFYSAPSSPLLLRGAPNYSTDTVSEFHTEAHRQLQVKDLPKVPT